MLKLKVKQWLYTPNMSTVCRAEVSTFRYSAANGFPNLIKQQHWANTSPEVLRQKHFHTFHKVQSLRSDHELGMKRTLPRITAWLVRFN